MAHSLTNLNGQFPQATLLAGFAPGVNSHMQTLTYLSMIARRTANKLIFHIKKFDFPPASRPPADLNVVDWGGIGGISATLKSIILLISKRWISPAPPAVRFFVGLA
jgi:hypothetical protein